MPRIRTWTDEATETDFALRSTSGAFELLLPGRPPRRGRRRWSLEARDLGTVTRWDVVEVDEGTFVVRDRTEDDFRNRFSTRTVAAWPAPGDLARFPRRLAGASPSVVRAFLLDGLVEECPIFRACFDPDEEPERSAFRLVGGRGLPTGLFARFQQARREVLSRAIDDACDAGALPACCATRCVVYYDGWGVDVLGDTEWRAAFPLRFGGRDGFLVVQWTEGDTPAPEEALDVHGWFVAGQPHEAILRPVPGLPMGVLLRAGALRAGPAAAL